MEKLFKAILIKRNIYALIHNLVRLAELIEEEYHVKIINSIVDLYDLERLSAHYILSRCAPPRGTSDGEKWERLARRYGGYRYGRNTLRI